MVSSSKSKEKKGNKAETVDSEDDAGADGSDIEDDVPDGMYDEKDEDSDLEEDSEAFEYDGELSGGDMDEEGDDIDDEEMGDLEDESIDGAESGEEEAEETTAKTDDNNKKDGDEYWEDIYGRLRTKDGAVVMIFVYSPFRSELNPFRTIN